MTKTGWHRAAATVGLVSAIAWAAVQAGCGSDAQQPPAGGDGGDSGNSAPDGMPGDETVFIGADGGGPVTSISILPASPIVDVTITDGVISTAPLTLTALAKRPASLTVSGPFTLTAPLTVSGPFMLTAPLTVSGPFMLTVPLTVSAPLTVSGPLMLTALANRLTPLTVRVPHTVRLSS